MKILKFDSGIIAVVDECNKAGVIDAYVGIWNSVREAQDIGIDHCA